VEGEPVKGLAAWYSGRWQAHPEARRMDPLTREAYAEALVRRTAEELARVLEEMARALDPFPAFLGMPTLQAVEVEGNLGGPDRGCIVVTPEGRLCELAIRMLPTPLETGIVDTVEEFRDLDLAPEEFIYYALRAIRTLARLLQERGIGA